MYIYSFIEHLAAQMNMPSAVVQAERRLMEASMKGYKEQLFPNVPF